MISSILKAFVISAILASGTVGETVREPIVAGTFYPNQRDELAATVNHHLSNVSNLPSIDGQIIAIIVPHAGLVYSGQIAAFAYKLIEDNPIKNVVLCGPSHHYALQGLSIYGPGIKWKTPLGTVSCNDSLCQKLLDFDKGINVNKKAHLKEHCLEVQLPYLQTVLSDFEIVPIIIGQQNHTAISMLADVLSAQKFDSSTIMVASTDWQHYHPAKVGWPMDSLGIDCVVNLDADRLESYLKNGEVEMCGGGPTVAIMRAAIKMGANSVKILRYGDSGDITGDKSSVVSYVAAVIYKANDEVSEAGNDSHSSTNLSQDDRKQLLDIARLSIESYLKDKTIPDFEVSGLIAQPGAAFVTLEKNGQLRGCIGHTVAVEPLYKTVSVCAVQAAVADRRFPPVQAGELPNLHIEISWLTPLERIESLDEIQVGRDGLMITLGNKRGLLLPQVATEYGWNRTQFLENTCHKAGLPSDAYKAPEVVIEKFQAVIFGE